MINRLSLSIIIVILTVPGFACDIEALTITPDRQFQFAEQLFDSRQYLPAAREYQRFTFFFPEDGRRRLSIYKTGEAFLLAGDPVSAADRFMEITDGKPLDPIAVDAYFMLAECRLQMKAPTQAAMDLHNLIVLSDDAAVKDRAYHRLGWLHMDQTDWTAAKRAFSGISPAGRTRYRIDDLERALDSTSQITTRSPVLAGMLSIVPGGGQLYCNRYEDALIAFVVNLGLFWAANDAFDKDQYALGGLLSFVGLGFYAGNIYGAVTGAHKFNRLQKTGFTQTLKQQRIVGEAPGETKIAAPLLFSLHVPF